MHASSNREVSVTTHAWHAVTPEPRLTKAAQKLHSRVYDKHLRHHCSPTWNFSADGSTCSSHWPSPNPGDTGIFCHLGSSIFSTLRHGWDPPPGPAETAQCVYTSHRLLGARGSFLSPQPSMVLPGCSWESSRNAQAQRTVGKSSNLDIYFFLKHGAPA